MTIAMLTKSALKLALVPLRLKPGILHFRVRFKPYTSPSPWQESFRSCHFVRCSGNVDLNLLHTKVGMDRFQDRLAGIFLSANPDCPGPAYQRKRIVADQICRAL